MSLAQRFIDQLHQHSSPGHDHTAVIGPDGDARLTRFEGRDLPWAIPVRITETGWARMTELIAPAAAGLTGVDFALNLSEELYKLDLRDWKDPELLLQKATGRWMLVDAHLPVNWAAEFVASLPTDTSGLTWTPTPPPADPG